jgi:hypothetical protein
MELVWFDWMDMLTPWTSLASIPYCVESQPRDRDLNARVRRDQAWSRWLTVGAGRTWSGGEVSCQDLSLQERRWSMARLAAQDRSGSRVTVKKRHHPDSLTGHVGVLSTAPRMTTRSARLLTPA